MKLKPIGIIRSPYQTRKECPSNGREVDTLCEIQIADQYQDGLYGLKKGMEIHVLWCFNKASREVLRQPYEPGSDKLGVFAMRSPERPNPIALSLCRIEEMSGRKLSVIGLEAIDGSKVIDIKRAVEYDGMVL